MKIFMKIIMWVFIVLGTVVVGFLGYYFISVSGQIMEVTWNKISYKELGEVGINANDLQSIGLNAELVRDIEKDPEKYRYIVFVMKFNNRSKIWPE